HCVARFCSRRSTKPTCEPLVDALYPSPDEKRALAGGIPWQKDSARLSWVENPRGGSQFGSGRLAGFY
ncbi:MAG TPA: hypothetical protein VGY54_25635, partial [Polyangiaceae bacterium]|nr:hypothetical protein [Polyangiaceae bacterium]